jgi:FixJ family two-component response regulator
MPDVNVKGRLLLADDEVSFLKSTGELLRDEGYECDCVPDGKSAAEALDTNKYDVLIADIKMPGNLDLELIRKVKDLDEGLPVILVTGYPSMKTAIDSVGLPVVAYLVKPLDFKDLVQQVESAISRSRAYNAVRRTQERLLDWHGDLEEIKNVLSYKPDATLTVPTDAYVAVALRHIVGGLTDLKKMVAAMAVASDQREVCSFLECPKMQKLTDALKDTIEVIERSKRSFRSKELSELRKKLEGIIDEAG